MLRATFFASGLFVLLWGVSLLFIDKFVLRGDEAPAAEPAQAQRRPAGFRGMLGMRTEPVPEVQAEQSILDPPDWAAFSLMSLGTVTMLYAVALPKKKQG